MFNREKRDKRMLNQDLTARTLNINEIRSFLDLQASVPEEKRKFVKPRTAEDLQAHMEAGMPILGVYDGEKLVAAALLTFPGHEGATKFLDGYPLTQTTAVIQSVSSIQKGTIRIILLRLKRYTQRLGRVAWPGLQSCISMSGTNTGITFWIPISSMK